MKKIGVLIKDVHGYAGTENVTNFMVSQLVNDSEISIYSLSGDGETFYPFSGVKNKITLKNKLLKLFSVAWRLKKEKLDFFMVISMGRLSIIFSIYIFFLKVLGVKTKFIACEHVSYSSFSLLIRVLKSLSLRVYYKVVVLTESDSSIYKSKKISSIVISNPLFKKNIERDCFNKKFLAVGRLEEQKGFERLLRIWSSFVGRCNGAKLFIAGDGSQRSHLESLISQYGIHDSVFLMGQVDDMDSLFMACDIFLMTSYYEGLPMVLLEAKSWSMPIISFDCPTGPKEIVADGYNGFLIENDDECAFEFAMEKVFNEIDLFYFLSKNQSENSMAFDPNYIGGQWRDLIS